LNIYNIEQYILFLLVKHSELDLRDLKLKILKVEPTLSDKLLSYKLSLLREEGYIEFIEELSVEYKKCLEKQSDKRIKNIAKYCRERYPSKILVRITENGKIKYIHNCYCLSYCNTKNEETALLNMALCEELADMKTMPPEECLC
jgi:DNA-binding transcriptional ArsR family regulator